MPPIRIAPPKSRPAFQVGMLAASLALGLAGCSTPAVHPKVDVPAQYAAAAASDMQPEAAWWEAFHDPVLTDLVGRAALAKRQ